MKQWFGFFILYLISFSAFAEDFKVYVQTFDHDIDLTQLQSANVEAKDKLPQPNSQVADLPAPHQMNQMFKQAGFGEEVLGMEQMDKDLFYLKVLKRPMDYLKKKYPELDAKKIKKLKEIVGSTV